MFDDLSKLVKQTFENQTSIKERKSNLDNFFDFEDELSKVTYPDSPGLIYILDQKKFLFILKGFASPNLKKDFKLMAKSPEMYPSLGMINRPEIKINFFETKTLDMAQTLKKNFCNQRFPIEEEHIFNVSDPSLSWWMRSDSQSIELYFKLVGSPADLKLKKIGPLGDGRVVMQCFSKLRPYLNNLFPIKMFSVSDEQIIMKVEEESDIFSEFLAIFKTGKPLSDFWQYLETNELMQSSLSKRQFLYARLFLYELSIQRSFWSDVEKKISAYLKNETEKLRF